MTFIYAFDIVASLINTSTFGRWNLGRLHLGNSDIVDRHQTLQGIFCQSRKSKIISSDSLCLDQLCF